MGRNKSQVKISTRPLLVSLFQYRRGGLNAILPNTYDYEKARRGVVVMCNNKVASHYDIDLDYSYQYQ